MAKKKVEISEVEKSMEDVVIEKLGAAKSQGGIQHFDPKTGKLPDRAVQTEPERSSYGQNP